MGKLLEVEKPDVKASPKDKLKMAIYNAVNIGKANFKKNVSQNEDFVRADTTTFKSVKDLNRQYIANTSLLALYCTQIRNASILETK